uniref:class I SAM-dependent methyltransferase n=1 Tax=Sphingopyxis sp. TaxID=1908224 RepID=UPI0035AECE42
MTETNRDFVPALGKAGNIERYDAVVALMTREKRWRSDLLRLVAPRPGETIVDIGCGTGTLAIALGGTEPECAILGVDPDPGVLDIARQKAHAAGARVQWFEAMGDALDAIEPLQGCQTAFKRDPRSASKRDPLFGYDAGLLKMALRCVRRRAGVARPEAR